MKTGKKLISICLAALLLLSMGVTAFAGGGDNQRIIEVTLIAGEGGFVGETGGKKQDVILAPTGEMVEVCAWPSEGYHFVAWLCDGEVFDSEEVLDFYPNDNITLTATFKKDASANAITNVSIRYVIPTVGDPVSEPSITVSNGLAVESYIILYYDDENDSFKKVPKGASFEAGESYSIEFGIAKGENDFSDDLTVTVNEKPLEPARQFRQTNTAILVKYQFQAKAASSTDPGKTDPTPDQQPKNQCKWCGKTHKGFFQSIIGFFHRILAAVFGEKF